jgi:hypothetical protein
MSGRENRSGRIERNRDVNGSCAAAAACNQPHLEPAGQRLALEVLHDEIRRAVLFADVVQRADVRVLELRDRARFTIEPLSELRIASKRGWKDFDGDDAIETRVAGLVDLTHAAGADGGLNLVRAEPHAGRKGKTPDCTRAAAATSGISDPVAAGVL